MKYGKQRTFGWGKKRQAMDLRNRLARKRRSTYLIKGKKGWTVYSYK